MDRQPHKKIENITLPVSPAREAEIKRFFEEYLALGAFPAIALRTVLQRELLSNYFEDFLYKDIAARHEVNISKLKDLAIYLATHSANLFSYRNIAKAMDLHPNTVNDYINYMKEVFLFDEVYKFDFSLKTQFSHQKKIYMIDTGLANAVSFRFSKDQGRTLETLVYRALKRKFKEIYFHRDKKECDFLIKEGLEVTRLIQVTYSLLDVKTKEREVAGLLEAMQAYHLKEGLILTENESDEFEMEVQNTHYRISVQPLWKWLLLR